MTVTNATADAGSAKLYDMVTAVPEQTLKKFDDKEEVLPSTAVVIAGGDRPLPADKFYPSPTAPTKVDVELTAARKAHRQARFPVGLLQAAFLIKVEDGQASVETDKRHILNALTGMPLDSEPPLTHEQYDRINKLLHAHYALGGLPRCVAEGGEALEQCLAALRASPPTDRFVVSVPFDDATVEQLIDLLPPTLQHLEMSDASMTVVPESVGKFTALRTLDLSGCQKLTALPESVGNLGALQTLNLRSCYELEMLPVSISLLTQLDEASRKEVTAILAGALAAMPLAAARDCTAFVPSTPSARAPFVFGAAAPVTASSAVPAASHTCLPAFSFGPAPPKFAAAATAAKVVGLATDRSCRYMNTQTYIHIYIVNYVHIPIYICSRAVHLPPTAVVWQPSHARGRAAHVRRYSCERTTLRSVSPSPMRRTRPRPPARPPSSRS